MSAATATKQLRCDENAACEPIQASDHQYRTCAPRVCQCLDKLGPVLEVVAAGGLDLVIIRNDRGTGAFGIRPYARGARPFQGRTCLVFSYSRDNRRQSEPSRHLSVTCVVKNK